MLKTLTEQKKIDCFSLGGPPAKKKKNVYYSCNFFLLKQKYLSICFLLSLVDLFFFLILQLLFCKAPGQTVQLLLYTWYCKHY